MRAAREVNLPFNDRFRDQMLKGLKTMTSRTKRYGETGNTFAAFGATFLIRVTTQFTLGEIARYFYRNEGFSSPEEFIAFWNEIHPRKGYDPEQKVYVHDFSKGE